MSLSVLLYDELPFEFGVILFIFMFIFVFIFFILFLFDFPVGVLQNVFEDGDVCEFMLLGSILRLVLIRKSFKFLIKL